jgi:excisionase family DNA binding protein
MTAKEAAEVTGVTLRTLYRQCADGNVWAYRIFNGTSPWFVVVAPDGLPADPPGTAEPACTRCAPDAEVEPTSAP